MDLNTVRSLVTLVSFLVFAGIVYWAWSGSNRARFDEAANLPFVDDDLPKKATNRQHTSSKPNGTHHD